MDGLGKQNQEDLGREEGEGLTAGNSDSSRLRGSGEQIVSSVQDRRCEMPVMDWVDMSGAQVVTSVCNSEKFLADDTNLKIPMALSILI